MAININDLQGALQPKTQSIPTTVRPVRQTNPVQIGAPPGTLTPVTVGQLPASSITGVMNDTNITGIITAQNLILGWKGTLAAIRLNSNVVQSVASDTNITGVIGNQNLILGWKNELSVARGGTGTSTPSLVAGSNVTITGTWPDQTINATGGGVTSINTLTGAIVLAAGSGLSLSTVGNTLTFTNASSGGTVTSVGLTDSTGLFTVTNSPVTTSGSLTLSAYASQTANYVLRSGSGTPTFSALALTDLPAIAASNLSNGVTGTGNVVLKSGPTLTGVPLAPTASALTNNTQIATTGYADAAVAVEVSRAEIAEALLSPLASPTFTGTAAFANITVSGTTSFAANAISLASVSGAAPLASPAFTGTPSLPTGTTGITQSAGTANTTIATTQFVTTAVGTLSDAFSSITTGINVAATMTMGPGSKLTFSGSGSPPYEGEINANFLYGVQIEPYAPTVGQVLTAISTSAANWQTPTGGSGNVSSVFGRTGAVVAVSGDYTVAQVTGAAPLVSPSFTTPALGTASSGVLSACTTATQAPLANNTDLASCAYVDNIAFGVGSAVLREDFINAGYNSSVSTGAGGTRFYSDETWSVISVGGAGLAEPQASTFANPGQIIMTTAATTAYGVALYAGTGYNCCGVLGSNAPWQLDFIIKLSQTATCCFRGGFCISTFVMTSAAPTDGIYVEYDTGNTGNTATDFTWVTAKASSYSYSTTNAIAVDATNWHHFRIRSTVAGTVGFTVDGGTEFTTTSDVPTTASGMAPFFQIVSRQASTAKSLQMDFVGYQAATGRT